MFRFPLILLLLLATSIANAKYGPSCRALLNKAAKTLNAERIQGAKELFKSKGVKVLMKENRKLGKHFLIVPEMASELNEYALDLKEKYGVLAVVYAPGLFDEYTGALYDPDLRTVFISDLEVIEGRPTPLAIHEKGHAILDFLSLTGKDCFYFAQLSAKNGKKFRNSTYADGFPFEEFYTYSLQMSRDFEYSDHSSRIWGNINIVMDLVEDALIEVREAKKNFETTSEIENLGRWSKSKFRQSMVDRIFLELVPNGNSLTFDLYYPEVRNSRWFSNFAAKFHPHRGSRSPKVNSLVLDLLNDKLKNLVKFKAHFLAIKELFIEGTYKDSPRLLKQAVADLNTFAESLLPE